MSKMTRIMAATTAAGWFLLGDPMLAGSLAVYREFSIGSTVSEVVASRSSAGIECQDRARTAGVHTVVEWRPHTLQIAPAGDPVRDIRFRFSNDRLYQLLVTYNGGASKA